MFNKKATKLLQQKTCFTKPNTNRIRTQNRQHKRQKMALFLLVVGITLSIEAVIVTVNNMLKNSVIEGYELEVWDIDLKGEEAGCKNTIVCYW